MTNEIAEHFERVRDNANANRKHQLNIMEAALTVLQRDLGTLDGQLKRLQAAADRLEVERDALEQADPARARAIEKLGRGEAITAGVQVSYPVEDTLEAVERRLLLLQSAYRRFLAEDRAMEALYAIAEWHDELESVLPAQLRVDRG